MASAVRRAASTMIAAMSFISCSKVRMSYTSIAWTDGLHLVDRVVHRPDQRGDRAAVERRQEGLAHGLEHLACDVVGVLLALDHFADMVGGMARSSLHQPGQSVGGADDRPPHALRTWSKKLPCLGNRRWNHANIGLILD